MPVITREEVALASLLGSEHVSQLDYDLPDFFCRAPKPVKAETIGRSVRKAFSIRVTIQATPQDTSWWYVTVHAKEDAICSTIYRFNSLSHERVRARVLVQNERQELDAIAKKGKRRVRKTIDD
jgi:hypothetical protein